MNNPIDLARDAPKVRYYHDEAERYLELMERTPWPFMRPYYRRKSDEYYAKWRASLEAERKWQRARKNYVYGVNR